MTVYQDHVREWKSCTKCGLCKTRKKVVFARGVIPCDVLFVGEAPGVSEDLLGIPFIGPAGKLLDEIIQEADQLRFTDYEDYCNSDSLRIARYNLVGCIPLVEGQKVGQPPKEALRECTPRLAEMVEIARPKLIVAVGQVAAKEIPKMLRGDYEPKGSGQGGRGKTAVGRPATGRVEGGRVARIQVCELGAEAHGDQRDSKYGEAIPLVEITHPAAILRANVSGRGLMVRRCVVALIDAFNDTMKGD